MNPSKPPKQTNQPNPPKQTNKPAGGKLPLGDTKRGGPARPHETTQKPK